MFVMAGHGWAYFTSSINYLSHPKSRSRTKMMACLLQGCRCNGGSLKSGRGPSPRRPNVLPVAMSRSIGS